MKFKVGDWIKAPHTGDILEIISEPFEKEGWILCKTKLISSLDYPTLVGQIEEDWIIEGYTLANHKKSPLYKALKGEK